METINKVKRQPMDWEKIFAKDAINRGYYSKHIDSSYTQY